MWTTIFLWVNAGLYAIFGLWCTANPTGVMRFLGQAPVQGQGVIEFLAVYGGLQIGLALFFLACAREPSMARSGMWLGLCLYGAIVLWRIGALLMHGAPSEKGIYGVFALEIALLLLAIAAWYDDRSRLP